MADTTAGDMVQAGTHSAQTLASDLLRRVQDSDDLDSQEVLRGAKTLFVLVRNLHETAELSPQLANEVQQLTYALTVRVGEAVESGENDNAYHLGKAIHLLRVFRGAKR